MPGAAHRLRRGFRQCHDVDRCCVDHFGYGNVAPRHDIEQHDHVGSCHDIEHHDHDVFDLLHYVEPCHDIERSRNIDLTGRVLNGEYIVHRTAVGFGSSIHIGTGPERCHDDSEPR